MAIHERQYYRSLSEDQIFGQLTSEGHAPTRVADSPGTVYSNHRHSCDLILAFLQGSADIQIGDKHYPCIAGDRLQHSRRAPALRRRRRAWRRLLDDTDGKLRRLSSSAHPAKFASFYQRLVRSH